MNYYILFLCLALLSSIKSAKKSVGVPPIPYNSASQTLIPTISKKRFALLLLRLSLTPRSLHILMHEYQSRGLNRFAPNPIV